MYNYFCVCSYLPSENIFKLPDDDALHLCPFKPIHQGRHYFIISWRRNHYGPLWTRFQIFKNFPCTLTLQSVHSPLNVKCLFQNLSSHCLNLEKKMWRVIIFPQITFFIFTPNFKASVLIGLDLAIKKKKNFLNYHLLKVSLCTWGNSFQ